MKAKNKKFYFFIKRLLDIICSILFLLLVGWFILIILLIKFFEDFHNPVYVSTRIGLNGKEFKFYKIRTMVPGAQDLKEELINKNMNEGTGPTFKIENDPRITKFGKFLRKTSIDEFPQVINVLKGDISVIGPRSPLPQEVEQYSDYERNVYQ